MEKYVTYNLEFKLAICISCQAGLPDKGVLWHFMDRHKETWKVHRDTLKEHIKEMDLADMRDISYPEELREPVIGIIIIIIMIHIILACKHRLWRALSNVSDVSDHRLYYSNL